MVDVAIALKLYQSGETLQSIGDKFNVSRQRISQVLAPHQPRQIVRARYNRHVNSTLTLPTPAERWVLQELVNRGYDAEFTQFHDTYSILVNNTIRIEVKHRTTTKRLDGFCHVGGLARNNFDYLIAIIGTLGTTNVYIIPSKELSQNVSLSLHPYAKSKHVKDHLQNWDLIV